MDNRQYSIKLAEIAIAIIGVVALLLGGYQTYMTYRQNAELQAIRSLHDAQLDACRKLVVSGARFFSARSPGEFYESFLHYSEIKHADALLLLDRNTLDAAMALHNATVPALQIEDGVTFRKEIRCALGDLPFKLTLACRESLSEAYKREARSDLSPIADSYVTGWISSC